MNQTFSSKNRAWERQAETEYNFLCNETIKRFWEEKFSNICSSHSFINEFELQNKTIDFEFVKDFFITELSSLATNTRADFSHEYSSNGEVTFCFKFPEYGLQEKYVSKIFLQVTKKFLILRMDPVNSAYKKADLLEYKSVLRIINDLLAVDLSELIKSMQSIYPTCWLTEKNAELAACSISNICNGILGTASIKYRVANYALVSVLNFEEMPNKWVQKLFIHKEFCDNPKTVIEFLQNLIDGEVNV